jgi:hypothetical protein
MTWLLDDVDAGGEKHAVLGLHPEVAALLEEYLEVACGITDERLLELAWRQLAEQLGSAPTVPEAGANGVAGAPNGELEHAVRAYVAQFAVDPNGITEALNAELAGHLSQSGLVDFVSALNAVDGYLRTCALLGLDPGPPPPSHAARAVVTRELPARPVDGDGPAMRAYRLAVVDIGLLEARTAFSKAAMRLEGVEDVTTEAARLRNASFQQCHY